MKLELVSVVIFLLGLLLYLLPIGPKANEVGRILMLAGAIGFALEGHHTVTIQ